MITTIIILNILLVASSAPVTVQVVEPSDLRQSIGAHVSPIGFKPLSGRIEAQLILSDPIGACSQLSDLNE